MNTAPAINPLEGMMYCPSKGMYQMVVNAEKKYKKAIYDAMQNIMPSLVIAMYENSNVRWEGVLRWKKTLIDVIEQCAAEPDLTIFQVLEDETGLELQIGDGKSFHDATFANAKLFDERMADNDPRKWVLYYQKKSKWATVTVMAACLLACHKQFRWGVTGMMNTMREQSEYIMDYYKRKPKAIAREFTKVTGHKVVELWDDVKK